MKLHGYYEILQGIDQINTEGPAWIVLFVEEKRTSHHHQAQDTQDLMMTSPHHQQLHLASIFIVQPYNPPNRSNPQSSTVEE
jgi:hypothetical protein